MSALERLSGLLQGSLRAADRPFPIESTLDAVIAKLKKHNSSGPNEAIPQDLQQRAVLRFWEAQRFETLKDARLVSFGMCVPSRPAGPCIMEDRQRFQAVLDSRTGVDQWLDEPRWYRRCYQGLVRSYFTYDPQSSSVPTIGRRNWTDLRDYLHERSPHIVDEKVNPDWVSTAVENRRLFAEEPCVSYAARILAGDASQIEPLCEQLGIIKASWFQHELLLAQVREATKLSQEKFKQLIPFLLELLSKNQLLRDQGLVLVLDKYASAPLPAIDEHLKDAAVEWWGNPWLPSSEARWGGVVPEARAMVSEWLKREFIEAFFAKLAQDGVGDRRRANFWLRYVKSMGQVHFALGAQALYSSDKDFVALRKKMKGLYTELKTGDSSNNAFVMTLGNLVAVEFGGMGNAFYGYDERQTLPFDMSRPVGTTVNARNSLKHDSKLLWMRHQDGIKGWTKWEDMFESTLQKHFDIRPNTMPPAAATRILRQQPQSSSPPTHVYRTDARGTGNGEREADTGLYSLAALESFASARGLRLDNRTATNGNLWIRTDDNDLGVNKILLDWGFNYKAPKGWWR